MLNNLLQIHLKPQRKKEIQRTAEATGNLINNKMVDKVIGPSRTFLGKTKDVGF